MQFLKFFENISDPKFQNHGGESFSSSRKPLGSIPHIFNQSKDGHSYFGNNHFGYQKQQGNNFHRYFSKKYLDVPSNLRL